MKKKVILGILLIMICLIITVVEISMNKGTLDMEDFSGEMALSVEETNPMIESGYTPYAPNEEWEFEDEEGIKDDVEETELVEKDTEIPDNRSSLEILEESVGIITAYDYTVLRDNVPYEVYKKALQEIKNYLDGSVFEWGFIDSYFKDSENGKTFYLVIEDYMVLQIDCTETGLVSVDKCNLKKDDLYKLYVTENYSSEVYRNDVDETKASTLDIGGTTLFLNTDCYKYLCNYLKYGYGTCTYLFNVQNNEMIYFYIKTDKCYIEGMYNTEKKTISVYEADYSDQEVMLKMLEGGN